MYRRKRAHRMAHAERAMSDRVLTIVHQEHSTTGRVGELLVERAACLYRRGPPPGEPRPDGPAPCAAAIGFGGPQSGHAAPLPGTRAERAGLEPEALPAGIPLLGICLGAQMIARVLGSRVGP